MRGVVIEAVGQLALTDVPETPLGEYEARTQLVCASICNSTDRKLVDGTFPGCTNFPALLGHEAVGKVIEVGAKVRNYRVGDLVIRPRQYYENSEIDLEEYFGSFADRGKVTDQWARIDDGLVEPDELGHPQQVLPAGCDPAVGVMAITYKETLSWMRRFSVGPETSVAVFGTGPVGVCFVLWAKYLGARQTILVGRTESSIKRAAEYCEPDAIVNTLAGDVADRIRDVSGGRGVERVVEGVGDNRIIDWGLDCITENGLVGVYGVPPNNQESATHARDTRVRYITPDEAEVHAEFFRLVAEERIDPMQIATHRLPLSEIERGFDALASRDAFKVLLDA